MFFRKSFRKSRSSKTEKYRSVNTKCSASASTPNQNNYSSTSNTSHRPSDTSHHSDTSTSTTTDNNNKDTSASPHLYHHHNTRDSRNRDSNCYCPIPRQNRTDENRHNLSPHFNYHHNTSYRDSSNHSPTQCRNSHSPIPIPPQNQDRIDGKNPTLNHHDNNSYRNSCGHSPISQNQDEFTVNAGDHPCTSNNGTASTSDNHQEICRFSINRNLTDEDDLSQSLNGHHSCTIDKSVTTDNHSQNQQNCRCINIDDNKRTTGNSHTHQSSQQICTCILNENATENHKQRPRICCCKTTGKRVISGTDAQTIHSCSCMISKHGTIDSHIQSSQLTCKSTTGEHESVVDSSRDNHSSKSYISSKNYHWRIGQNGSEDSNSLKVKKDTPTSTKTKMLKSTTFEMSEEEEEDEDIEKLFHQCFSNKQWQNAVLYTVVKTSLTNPELKTSIRREGDRNYQGRLHRRLSSGISNFYQLLEVHKMESRKGQDPDLMSLSHVLR